MEYKIIIPAKFIAVLKLFAPKTDVRWHLNGIALEIGASESRVVAIDGPRLGMFRIKSDQPDVPLSEPLTNIIIPIALFQHVKSTGFVEVTLGEPEGIVQCNARPVALAYAGVSTSGMTIDGVYPDFRRIIPTETSGVAAQFSPSYLGDLHKAAVLLGYKDKCVGALSHNGDGAALFHLDDDFVGVLMPWRIEAPKRPHDWAHDALTGASQLEPVAEAA